MNHAVDESRHRLSPAARRLLGIGAYYAVAAAAIAMVWYFVPAAHRYLDVGAVRALQSSEESSKFRDAAASLGALSLSAGDQARVALVTLVGALAAALPVAWVYSLTRRRKGFEQSMVHTLILLPIAVCGMVVLVQNHLALAFSLAGIVAILRFRNTLEDTKDGVYVFVVTSIGISAAVGALAIGVVTSIVFNASVLTLWWIDFARRPTPGIRGGLARLARLPKLAPERAAAGQRDERTRESVTDDAFESAVRVWRRRLQLTAEHQIARSSSPFNAMLRVNTSNGGASQPDVERMLDARAKRWKLHRIVPGEAGRVALEYHLRLRKDARRELIADLTAAPDTLSAEIERRNGDPSGAAR